MKRFSTSSLILIIVIIALLCGWIADHWRLQGEIATKRSRSSLQVESSRSSIAAKSWEIRLAEIRNLAAEKENPNIPLLLYALSDPDLRVRREALSALRKIPFSEYSTNGGRPDADVVNEFRRWLGDGEQIKSVDSVRMQFTKKLAEVRSGDSQKRVKQILGPPDQVRRDDESKPFHPYDPVTWCYGVAEGDPLPTLGTVRLRGEVVLWVTGGYGKPPATDIISETELRAGMRFLDPGPENAGYNDPLHLIRVTNFLHPLGKKKALAIIDEYARINDLRVDETWLFLLLRTLFDVPQPPGHMPDMLIGAMSPSPPSDKSRIPRFPIVVVDDIPFSLLWGVELGGERQPVSQHVDYFRNHGKIRANKLHPPDDPYLSFQKLLGSEEWNVMAKYNSDPRLLSNFEGHSLLQVLALGRTAYDPPEARQPRAYPKTSDYDRHHKSFADTGARWDEKLQIYVRRDGTHGQVGHLANIYK